MLNVVIVVMFVHLPSGSSHHDLRVTEEGLATNISSVAALAPCSPQKDMFFERMHTRPSCSLSLSLSLSCACLQPTRCCRVRTMCTCCHSFLDLHNVHDPWVGATTRDTKGQSQSTTIVRMGGVLMMCSCLSNEQAGWVYRGTTFSQ